MDNRYIVKYYKMFEDDFNCYLLFDHYKYKSMAYMLKYRETLTEHEVRYWLKQIIEGLRYIHQQNVVHRDFRIDNILIDENFMVKINDFALAEDLGSHDGRRRQVIGTPNYMAPEMIDVQTYNGYSYEIDIWAVGIMTYTLLVGCPPFDDTDVQNTYDKIRNNNYHIHPSMMSDDAKGFIEWILVTDPGERPTLSQLLWHPFMNARTLIPRSMDPDLLKNAPPAELIAEWDSQLNPDYVQEIDVNQLAQVTFTADVSEDGGLPALIKDKLKNALLSRVAEKKALRETKEQI